MDVRSRRSRSGRGKSESFIAKVVFRSTGLRNRYRFSLKITPKAFANVSQGFEHSENPGTTIDKDQTLKALGLCGVNPFRVRNDFSIDPRVVAALQPWAEISERLRRIEFKLNRYRAM